MPPRERRQPADGDPRSSDGDEGPSSQVAGLLDVLEAVLAHGRLCVGARHALRLSCRRARDAVDKAIRTLDLVSLAWGANKQEGQALAALLRFIARLSGLRKLSACLDAEVLARVLACISMRSLELVFLCDDCTPIGPVLAAVPGLKVRACHGPDSRTASPRPLCACF
jgi:hypothetical protein